MSLLRVVVSKKKKWWASVERKLDFINGKIWTCRVILTNVRDTVYKYLMGVAGTIGFVK